MRPLTSHADLVFHNALIIDGSGTEPRKGSVAVGGGRILAVGDLAPGQATRTIDADGLVLCPGFIDIHTHSDVSIVIDPAGESKILQGVTTEVTGNCGLSPFPLAPDRLELHDDHLRRIGGDVPPLTWTDMNGYAAAVEANPPALNIAPLIGHGTVRTAVMGLDENEPSPDDIRAMQALIGRDLDQGAFGFTTGLTLAPSSYGDEVEVAALATEVARRDAIYATHARLAGGERGELGALEEALRTAEAARCRLEWSHAAINEPAKWGRANEMIAAIEDARARGVDATYDVYPYDASSSGMTQYLPAWVLDGGTETMRHRLADPAAFEQAERDLARGFFGGIPWYWDRMLICRADAPDQWCVGLTIEQAAQREQMTPEAFALKLCLAHGNGVDIVMFYRTEEDMVTFLSHPLAVVGSDGSAIPIDQQGQRPHPRAFGTFPRVFGRYVREQNLMPLAEAVRKMTGEVAQRMRIADRGLVREGMVADLALFDPATVSDHATFTDPGQAPSGIPYVVVNGVLAVDEGQQTAARSGQVLRRGTR